jgi:serine/threonine-protein kinase
LLVTVARAVHHAHQRGILHRDLKPANILLDEEGTPYVSDFGLARRTVARTLNGQHGDLTASLLSLTQTGAIIGTPAYMAPEQATGQRGAVTVATDVYGLGAILYELLTGQPPFRGPTPFDTLCLVVEGEPARPSVLDPQVDRDLETICLKCLQKDPARRYSSAGELADDLERHLRGDPIRARPVGALERARRWVRRHLAVAALLAALLFALVGGLGLVFSEWRRAEHHRAQAETSAREAREQRDEAIRAGRRADRHRAEAEKSALLAKDQRDAARRHSEAADVSFLQAHQAVREFCLNVSREMENVPRLQPLRKKLLRSGLDYYRNFLRQRGQDPKLRLEMARTHSLMGKLADATGSYSEALAAYSQALVLFRRLHKEAPGDRRLRRSLCGALINVSVYQGANAGLVSLREARALYERFLRDDPGNLDLASGLAQTLNNMGSKYLNKGNLPLTRDCFERSLELQARLLRDHPVTRRWVRGEMAVTLHNLGVLASRLPGGHPLSLCYYRRVHEIRDQLARAQPRNASRQGDLAASLHSLGIAYRNLGMAQSSEAVFAEAIPLLRKLAADNPFLARYQVQLASGLTQVGVNHSRARRRDQALACYKEARDIQARLLRFDPRSAGLRRILGESHFNVGAVLGAMNRRPEEGAAFEEARRLQQELVRREPDNIEYRWDLGRTLNNLAFNLMVRRQPGRARTLVHQAIASTRLLIDRTPDMPQHRRLLTTHFALLALIELRAGRPAPAAEAVRDRYKLWPDSALQVFNCAAEMARVGAAVGKGKVAPSAEERTQQQRCYNEAMTWLNRAAGLGFADLRRLRADRDLAPLRTRPDFPAAAGVIEKNAKP